jgi:hypothetical protein
MLNGSTSGRIRSGTISFFIKERISDNYLRFTFAFGIPIACGPT